MRIHRDRSSDAAVRQKAPAPKGSPGGPHRTSSGGLAGGCQPALRRPPSRYDPPGDHGRCRNWVWTLVLLAAGAASAFGQTPKSAAPTPSERDAIRYIIVYGTDPCPRTSRDEIVICSRRPESERLRIPPNLREAPMSPESESWSKKMERLEMMGRTGINSCSASGPGGGTGCLLEMIKKAREEQQAQAQERAKAP